MPVDNLRGHVVECTVRYSTRGRKWLGKHPYDQRRSSAVLKGAMNLTRCLEIETRGGACSVYCYRPSPRHRLHTTKSGGSIDVLYITENYGSKKHNTEFPSTLSPGVIKSDVPTPGGSQQTIGIRFPRYFTEELANILVLGVCVPREVQGDAPDRIIRRIQE